MFFFQIQLENDNIVETVPVVKCTVSSLRTVFAGLLVRYNGRQWSHVTFTIHLDQVVANVMSQ